MQSFSISSGNYLAKMNYSTRGYDLVRFSEEAADGFIAEMVSSVVVGGLARRAAVRARRTEDETYQLVLFARRRSVEALRRNSLPLAVEAVNALTLVDLSKIDYRDLSVDFPLFAVRELGGDLRAVITDAINSSEPGTAGYFAARRRSARTTSLKDCALVRVSTAHGVGFMDDWTGASPPPTALAELAVELADSIEAEGTYTAAEMHVSDLPSVWFRGPQALDNEPVSGCVSIGLRHVAVEDRWSHGLLVFLADIPDERTIIELCRQLHTRSTLDRPCIAVAEGRLLATLIGGSTTEGEAALESVESLQRLSLIAGAVLRARVERDAIPSI